MKTLEQKRNLDFGKLMGMLLILAAFEIAGLLISRPVYAQSVDFETFLNSVKEGEFVLDDSTEDELMDLVEDGNRTEALNIYYDYFDVTPETETTAEEPQSVSSDVVTGGEALTDASAATEADASAAVSADAIAAVSADTIAAVSPDTGAAAVADPDPSEAVDVKAAEETGSDLKEPEGKESVIKESDIKESETKESETKESETKESETMESETKESETKEPETKESTAQPAAETPIDRNAEDTQPKADESEALETEEEASAVTSSDTGSDDQESPTADTENGDETALSTVEYVPLAAAGEVTLSPEDYQALCKIVEAEAKGEGRLGKLLVADVVLNRVESERFPDTVTAVVSQPGQFSPYRNGSYKRAIPSAETISAVNSALGGTDLSEDAIYFKNKKRGLSWGSKEIVKVYKNHAFYR